MLGHVLNVVVVLDEGVSIDTVLISAFESLNELRWVLLVKNDKDSGNAALVLGDLPDTLKSLRLGQILEETEFAPIAQFVLVLPETVSSSAIGGDVA